MQMMSLQEGAALPCIIAPMKEEDSLMSPGTVRNRLFATSACLFLLTSGIVADAQAAGNGSTMDQSPPTAQTGQIQPASEKPGAYMDDSAITMKVKAMLMKDESLKSLDIHVTTRRDIVTLTGSVKTMMESKRAAQIAEGVEGVKGVRNHLKQKTLD